MRIDQEPPYRKIIYRRSGNLSTETRLNGKVADQFMRVADMRKNFIVVDSDKKPAADAVAVSSDTLALRSINPLHKLNEVRISSSPLYTLAKQPGSYEIQIHERIIDHEIRRDGFIDRSDYQNQFLEYLNKSLKSGLVQGLRNEKLGLSDQSWAYLAYGLYLLQTGITRVRDGTYGMNWFDVSFLLLAYTPWMNYFMYLGRLGSKEHPYVRNVGTNWKELLLPLVPVDRWARGRLFLARHANELVIPATKQT